MADKPIKLTDAQLTTLQQVADPNYKSRWRTFEHEDLIHYPNRTCAVLARHELVELKRVGYSTHVFLTPAGRAHLDALGIAPIPLAPPPKTDKERIAELEAALRQIANYYDDDSLGNGFDDATDYLINLARTALGIKE